jgi:hypothetical protein
MRTEQRVDKYVNQALSSHDDLEGAAIWLAVFIANNAASSATDHVPAPLVEAYRRVRAMADKSGE